MRAAAALAVAVLISAAVACAPGPSQARITLDLARRYQVITGWEAVAWAADDEKSFMTFREPLFDELVGDLGINRLRLEVRAGAETRDDAFPDFFAGRIDYQAWRAKRYVTTNDNDNPDVIDPAGFRFSELDQKIDFVVTPVRERLQRLGQPLLVNLCYVAFTNQSPPGASYVHDDPREYAEFIEATWRHLRDKYGWVPDSLEIILEPDNVRQWSGQLIGRAIVEVARRFRAVGFAVPRIVAPSNTNMTKAVRYFDEAMEVEGVPRLLKELSYHRYGGISRTSLVAIRNRADRYGIDTAMIESGSVSQYTLHEDLKVGNNSAWGEYAIAGPNRLGGHYYYVDVSDPERPKVSLQDHAKYLRQYFKFIRPGAIRIGAETTNRNLDPVAFVNRDGAAVVVVLCVRPGRMTISGLPAGTYGVTFTTSDQFSVSSGGSTIAAGQDVTAVIPAAGVITIHGRR